MGQCRDSRGRVVGSQEVPQKAPLSRSADGGWGLFGVLTGAHPQPLLGLPAQSPGPSHPESAHQPLCRSQLDLILIDTELINYCACQAGNADAAPRHGGALPPGSVGRGGDFRVWKP